MVGKLLELTEALFRGGWLLGVRRLIEGSERSAAARRPVPNAGRSNTGRMYAMRRFQLDKGKAVEAVVFIASRVQDPTFHRISKILYFAELQHLERYGRLITGDTYIAMEYGLVPSYTYDAMKEAGDDRRVSDIVANVFEVAGNRRRMPGGLYCTARP